MLHRCPQGENDVTTILLFLALGTVRYNYVGCFKSPGHMPPKLKQLIMTERDPSSPVWNGQHVDWINWDAYMLALIKRCAKKADDQDFKVFGIRYYGMSTFMQ